MAHLAAALPFAAALSTLGLGSTGMAADAGKVRKHPHHHIFAARFILSTSRRETQRCSHSLECACVTVPPCPYNHVDLIVTLTSQSTPKCPRPSPRAYPEAI